MILERSHPAFNWPFFLVAFALTDFKARDSFFLEDRTDFDTLLFTGFSITSRPASMVLPAISDAGPAMLAGTS